MRLFVLLFIISSLGATIREHTLHDSIEKLNSFKNIKFLDTKVLAFDARGRIKVSELSALAYKDSLLYSLGDQGYLYKFKIDIENKKIKELELLEAKELRGKNNQSLSRKKRDSEGLVFLDDKLLISFEGESRVELFSLNGVELENKKIHKDLRDVSSYRSSNKALESVAYNKKYGVVTAPELPLKKSNKKEHTVYAENKTWKFKSAGSITALEFIDENRLMILQRDFYRPTARLIITLSSFNLATNTYKVLATLDNQEDWNVDNFEGLTKVSKNLYLMVSDDNDNFFQMTLLVLFELVE